MYEMAVSWRGAPTIDPVVCRARWWNRLDEHQGSVGHGRV